MFVSVAFIAMLVTPIAYLKSLICANENNGGKFYRRKSMRAADEKLIINKLDRHDDKVYEYLILYVV